MIRSAPRWRVYAIAAALCGLVAAGCDGDDGADRSAATDPNTDTSVELGGDDGDDPSSDEDPFTEECTLAVKEVKTLLDPPDDYLEKQVTSESDWAGCSWSSDGYSTDLSVNVKPYDDYSHDESAGKPIPGLGDESWFNAKVDSLYWRRDAYSVSVHTGVVTDFAERRLIDLAHAIDGDLP
jgi:hypothetical protein